MSAVPFPEQSVDFLTVLRHNTNRVAKVWRRDGTVSQYDDGKHFRVTRRPVSSLRVLSQILFELQTDPHSCVIRGDYRRGEHATIDAYAAAHDPDHKPGTLRRIKDLVDDVPHHWLLIDVDKFRPVLADPVADPEEAIAEYIEAALPREFHGASFHWQMSNSAGHESNAGVLKVHLWFWLEEPATGTQLTAWARAHRAQVDTSLFRVVQAHYTANPVFDDGVADPVPNRSGFVTLSHETVTLDLTDLPEDAAKPSRLAVLADAVSSDPTAQRLAELGMVKSQEASGRLNIVCPFEDGHSKASAETATVYYPAHTGGYERGHFVCLHDSCSHRADRDYLTALGLEDDIDAMFDSLDADSIDAPPFEPDAPGGDFEVLPDEPQADGHGETLSPKPTRERFTPWSTAEFLARPAPEWIIKGVLPAAELVVLYGESGAGKSFVGLDLAMHIAAGEPWRDQRTRAGRVVYVVAEGAGGFRNRLAAYVEHHAHAAPHRAGSQLDIIPAAPNLLEKAEAFELAKAIRERGRADVIFIDTLAQSMPGANENAGEDMGQVLAHCKRISKATGATVVLVHHAGKDVTRGARGWSGLRAAADAEIEIAKLNGCRVMRLSKQKDGDDSAEWFFDLVAVPIGVDADGDAITSCVIDWSVEPARAVLTEQAKTPVEKAVLAAVQTFAMAQTEGIEVRAVVAEAVNILPAPSGGKRDRRRDLVRRAVAAMAERGFWEVEDDCLSLGLGF